MFHINTISKQSIFTSNFSIFYCKEIYMPIKLMHVHHGYVACPSCFNPILSPGTHKRSICWNVSFLA
eukprot:NODE_4379_length_320_cov_212.328413_g4297_i0.p1 GENE.NODE_4379_length_320_cov_212.328413_g4297_i0~~NODE_4379_length_320_cov_212.328413_g4297_i0.p1  ORF type:complete len:67 (+),score=0.71 NODE_4379_length_320_cov_212.328413_g4297_i0:46-246(+)